jgi:hypothetical protein
VDPKATVAKLELQDSLDQLVSQVTKELQELVGLPEFKGRLEFRESRVHQDLQDQLVTLDFLVLRDHVVMPAHLGQLVQQVDLVIQDLLEALDKLERLEQ